MSSGLAPLSVRRYGASHGSHSHGHFQVLLGLSGVLELDVEGRGQRISEGSGCVIAPGERHDFESRAGSRCLVLDTADLRWAGCNAQPAHADQARALANYLSFALQQPASAIQLYAPALLLDAWRSEAPVQATRQRAINWRKLTDWAQQHLHRALTVADLAAQVFLSPTQFGVRCRLETGYTSMQWLRVQRLAHAQTLRGTGMKLVDAAGRCGYQSPSALTAALRRHTAAHTTVVTRQ